MGYDLDYTLSRVVSRGPYFFLLIIVDGMNIIIAHLASGLVYAYDGEVASGPATQSEKP